MIHRASMVWVIALASFVVSVPVCHALDGEPPEQDGAPAPDKILRQVSDYLGGLTSFSVHASLTLGDKSGKLKQELKLGFALAMKRPDRLSMTISSDSPEPRNMTFICDGRHVYMYVPADNKYAVEDAPSDVASILMNFGGGPVNIFMGFLAELVREAPLAKVLDKAERIEYLGQEKSGDVNRHHIKLALAEHNLELWVNDGDKPLIARCTLDLSAMFERAGGDDKPKLAGTFEFSDWVVDVELPDETFRFEPPEDAEKIDASETREPEEKSHPLQGKPAPALSLDLLDGGKMDLAAHKDKNIVVLDFWATWCGPCRVALPVLAEVTNEYKDKGVVFYAVNLGEAPKTIRAFLKKVGLNIAVALDTDGKTGGLYEVQGIPQTVIIGKNGTVEIVHVGVAPDLKTQLKGELDALTSR